MGTRCRAGLRDTIIDIVEENGPAITLDGLLDQVEGDPEEVVEILEELQHRGDIKHDVLLWRGGHSSNVS